MDLQNKMFVFFWIFDFIALVIVIVVSIKRRKKKLVGPLNKFANENNSKISEYDTWDKTYIGIDNEIIKCLFFIRDIPGKEIRKKINLTEVSECRMFKTERKVKLGKDTVNVIDRIELIFSFYNRKPELSLEFYNTEYDQLTLSGELQLAEKWTGILKSIINKNQGLKVKEQSHPSVLKTVG